MSDDFETPCHQELPSVEGPMIHRLKQQADRIVKLEAALRHCVNAIAEVEKCKPELLTYEMAFSLRPFLLGAMDSARKTLEEKDE